MIKIKTLIIFAMIIVITGCTVPYVKKSQNSISFFYNKTNAKNVVFYSDLNSFKGEPFTQKEEYWVYSMDKPADTNEIKFFYKVDGNVVVPDCRMKIDDGFGGKLCILEF